MARQKFKEYKPEDISNGYLMAIINFCKRAYRPKEQVETLEKLAKERCENLYKKDNEDAQSRASMARYT